MYSHGTHSTYSHGTHTSTHAHTHGTHAHTTRARALMHTRTTHMHTTHTRALMYTYAQHTCSRDTYTNMHTRTAHMLTRHAHEHSCRSIDKYIRALMYVHSRGSVGDTRVHKQNCRTGLDQPPPTVLPSPTSATTGSAAGPQATPRTLDTDPSKVETTSAVEVPAMSQSRTSLRLRHSDPTPDGA